jgi:hypothetical protein
MCTNDELCKPLLLPRDIYMQYHRFVVAPTAAVLSRRKPASAGASSDTCSGVDSDKRAAHYLELLNGQGTSNISLRLITHQAMKAWG